MNADTNSVKKLVYNIGEELTKNYGKHPAITHYQNMYGYVPPFVLVKVFVYSLPKSCQAAANLKSASTICISLRYSYAALICCCKDKV